MLNDKPASPPPGLQPHAVSIVPYHKHWPAKAQYHIERLTAALSDNLIRIEHIGSTSVPGLPAKAIIDLLPLVKDLSVLDSERSRVESLGLVWHGPFGIDGRRFCTLTQDGVRLVHVHFFQHDNDAQVKRHLAFRDYLRVHPAIAQEYAVEKKRAAALHPNDSLKYNDEKAAWVRKHETDAMLWARYNKISITRV